MAVAAPGLRGGLACRRAPFAGSQPVRSGIQQRKSQETKLTQISVECKKAANLPFFLNNKNRVLNILDQTNPVVILRSTHHDKIVRML